MDENRHDSLRQRLLTARKRRCLAQRWLGPVDRWTAPQASRSVLSSAAPPQRPGVPIGPSSPSLEPNLYFRNYANSRWPSCLLPRIHSESTALFDVRSNGIRFASSGSGPPAESFAANPSSAHALRPEDHSNRSKRSLIHLVDRHFLSTWQTNIAFKPTRSHQIFVTHRLMDWLQEIFS